MVINEKPLFNRCLIKLGNSKTKTRDLENDISQDDKNTSDKINKPNEVKEDLEITDKSNNNEEENNQILEPQAEPEAEHEVEPEVEPEAEPELEPEVEPELEPEVEENKQKTKPIEELKDTNLIDNKNQDDINEEIKENEKDIVTEKK